MIKNVQILIFLVLILSGSLNAQTMFQATYGGNYYDYCETIEQTADSGYIILGSTSSFGAGNSDVYLIKTDSLGNLKWSKTYGDLGVDYGKAIKQTTDDGYIIAGFTNSFDSSSYDIYLIKINSLGDTLWTRTYGGDDWDQAYSVEQTLDGGYIITGSTYSYGLGDADVYLIKTNSFGDTLWTKTIGGLNEDVGKYIHLNSDGSYIITGFSNSFGSGDYDAYLIKLNQSGATLWTKSIGSNLNEKSYSLAQTAGGGYILVGTSDNTTNNDTYIIGTNNNGDTLWTQTYYGLYNEEIFSIIKTHDNNYVLGGYTNSYGAGVGSTHDFYLFKIDSLGIFLGGSTFGSPDEDYAYSVQQTNDKGFIIGGITNGLGSGLSDIYFVKTDSLMNTGTFIQGFSENYLKNEFIKISPNPFNTSALLSIDPFFFSRVKSSDINFELFNLTGTCVKRLNKIQYNYIKLDRDKLVPGIYFGRLIIDNDIMITQKIIIQ